MRPPDQENAKLGVRVWTIGRPARIADVNPDWGAGLGAWLIEADRGVFSSIFTRWYCGVVHLRDVPGQSKPAHRQFPEAEYELMLFAVDTKMDKVDMVAGYEARTRGEDAPELDTGFLLQPADLTYQWVGTTDEQAISIAGSFIHAALAGEKIDRPVHPLEAAVYDAYWKRMLDGTVAHFVAGLHG